MPDSVCSGTWGRYPDYEPTNVENRDRDYFFSPESRRGNSEVRIITPGMNYLSFHPHPCPLPIKGEGTLCSLSSVRRGLG